MLRNILRHPVKRLLAAPLGKLALSCEKLILLSVFLCIVLNYFNTTNTTNLLSGTMERGSLLASRLS